jgi:hypothetical protein
VAVGEGKSGFAASFSLDTGSSIGEISGHSKIVNAVAMRPSRPFRAVFVALSRFSFSLRFLPEPRLTPSTSPVPVPTTSPSVYSTVSPSSSPRSLVATRGTFSHSITLLPANSSPQREATDKCSFTTDRLAKKRAPSSTVLLRTRRASSPRASPETVPRCFRVQRTAKRSFGMLRVRRSSRNGSLRAMRFSNNRSCVFFSSLPSRLSCPFS